MSRNTPTRQLKNGSGVALSPLPEHGGVVPSAPWWPLLLLLLLYLLSASVHALLVPTDQTGYQNAPDEAAHVNYVRELASGHLPTQQDAAQDPRKQSYEWHQPPLYYALASCALWAGPKGLRFVSILCGIAAIWLIFRTVRTLFPGEPGLAPLAAGLAALLPGHIAITSTVNNDALLEVCCSAALLGLVIILRNGMSQWRAGWLGVAIGAAMLTKATGLLLLPLLIIALPLLRRSGETSSNLARGYAWCLTVIVVLCGWWYARNGVMFHEILPLRAFDAAFRGTAQATQIETALGGWGGYWSLVSIMTYKSFWAVFGTPRDALVGRPAFLPETVYWLTACVVVVVLIGMGRLHLQRKEMTPTQTCALWLMFGFLGLVVAAFVSFLRHYFQTQGRYLYPAMLPICLILALGWRSVFPAKQRETASVLLLLLFGVLTALFLSTVQAAVM